MRWLDVNSAAKKELKIQNPGTSIHIQFSCADAEGGRWVIKQQFSPGPSHAGSGKTDANSGLIRVTTEVRVDQDRSVFFLPMFMLFPGTVGFGQTQGPCLFNGLEYREA